MYVNRVIELHLRQSVHGIWSETFGSGDIDYNKIATTLTKLNIKPHLVIEQCIEDKTKVNMTVVDAHKKDIEAVKTIFPWV
jgi:inosose dehydratase